MLARCRTLHRKFTLFFFFLIYRDVNMIRIPQDTQYFILLQILYLASYLIWRETRSMYSLWLLCSAIANTGTLCSELSLYLAGRLTNDLSFSKGSLLDQIKLFSETLRGLGAISKHDIIKNVFFGGHEDFAYIFCHISYS